MNLKAMLFKLAAMEKEAPFKSRSQMRKFFAMENRGELPKGKAKQWAHETPNIKSLPERKGKSKAASIEKAAAPASAQEIMEAVKTVGKSVQTLKGLLPAIQPQAVADTRSILFGGPLDFGQPRNWMQLLGIGAGGAAAGTAAGYGAARLTSPTMLSIDNLRKEEEAVMLARAANELRARIALRKQKLMGV